MAAESEESASEERLPRQVPSVIALADDGRMAPKDQAELYRVCQAWVRSGLVPRSMLVEERQTLSTDVAVMRVMMAAQMLRTLGLPPETHLRFVAMVKGTPSIFGDAPLAAVRARGVLAGRLEEYVVTADYERICVANRNLDAHPFAAVCRGQRRGEDVAERAFSLAEASRAGLVARSTVWQQYPQRMLQMRARSLLLKDIFPDVLGGVAIAEYDAGPELRPEHLGLPAVHGAARPATRVDDLTAAYPDDDAQEPA